MKVLVFFVAIILVAWQCHGSDPLRMNTGQGGHYIPEVSCQSWRHITSLSGSLFLQRELHARVEPYNATKFGEWVYLGKAPALPERRPLAQQDVTAKNLKTAGFHTWEKLITKLKEHRKL
ncbi:hypothetical protein JHK82_017255 [Glycine max]|nr:hypothetical protein JHK82_017255 [Glycine max]